MYLARIGEKRLKELSSCLSSKPEAETYERLEKGEFKIFYSFDESKKIITYEAAAENHDYLTFRVNSMKEFVESEEEDGLYCTTLPNVFAYFIALKESRMSEEELRKAYSKDEAKMGRFALISYEEARSIAESDKALNELKTNLLNSLPKAIFSRLPKLSFGFREKDKESLYLEVYVASGFSKKPIDDMAGFVEAFKNGTGAYLRPAGTTLCFSQETPYDDFLAKFLRVKEKVSPDYSYSSYYYKPVLPDPSVSKKNLPILLTYLIGEEVILDGETFVVPPLEKARLVQNAGLYFDLEPSLEKGGKGYFGQGLGFYVEPNGETCHFLSFGDNAAMAYFEFALAHPSFSYERYGKELGEAFSPFVSQRKEEKRETKSRGEVSDIAFYLGWEDDGSLLCHSEFYLSGDKVEYEDYASEGEIRKEKASRFLTALGVYGLEREGKIQNEKRIMAILGSDLSPLRHFCQFYLDEEIARVHIKPISKISFSISSGDNNWFDLTPHSDSYTLEELQQIASSYRKKKSFVLIRGAYLNLNDLKDTLAGEVFKKVDDLKSARLPLPVALGLSSYKEDGVKLDKKFIKIIDDIYGYEKADLSGLDPKVSSYLRPYQKNGVKWMKELGSYGLGGILGDEMGLGKTLQAIAFICQRQESLPSLVCAPKSLLYNWKEEFAKFNPKQKTVVLPCESKERAKLIRVMRSDEKVVYITSYDSVRIDSSLYKDRKFDCLIIDEAQVIANTKAQKSIAVKGINANCRFALTGTPIQNSLLDLWSVFDFFLPGYFPDYKDFSSEYGKIGFASEEKKKRLESKIAPFLLKRSKKDVAIDLPPKEESNVFLSLGEKQRKTYEAYLALARGELKLGDGNRIAILAALTRLRQICVSPELFLENEKDSVKIDYLMDSLEELLPAGHKALVFSSFTKALDLVSARLKKEKISHGYLHGEVSSSERIKMVNAFNVDKDTKVMLVSLKAGGTGLNLIGADTVFLLDPWWNLSAEEQAFARAHRIGQDKKVSIFRLVCEQTVEEKVLALQKKKKELTSILGGVSSSNIGKDDLEFLLS